MTSPCQVLLCTVLLMISRSKLMLTYERDVCLMEMAGAAQMGMLFVRDRGGISHSPLEFVAAEDIAAAAAALYMYLRDELQL